MENKISRRHFLKFTGLAIGTYWLGSFLDSPIGEKLDRVAELEFDGDKGTSVLDDKFKPLENNPSLLSSNFDFFRKIMEIIDPSIGFRIGMKCDFKNNVITITSSFRYRDIPDLMKVLSNKLDSKAFDMVFADMQRDYEGRAYYLLKASEDSSNMETYKEQALKFFTLSCLYKGIKDEKIIRQRFSDFIKQEGSDAEVENEMRNLVASNDSMEELRKKNYQKISLSEKEKKDFIVLLTKSPSSFIDGFESWIYGIIDLIGLEKVKEIKNILSIQIRTAVKSNEILNISPAESFNGLYRKIHDYLKGKESSDRTFSQKIDSDINKQIQISLKNDFEKGTYYVMSKDISPKFKKDIDVALRNSVGIFEKNSELSKTHVIEYISLVNYAKKRFKEGELKEFYDILSKGIKPFPNKELIAALPKEGQKEVLEIQTQMLKTAQSEKFKEILGDIKSGHFHDVKSRLGYLNDEEKVNTLYLIFSGIGEEVYDSVMHKMKYTDNFSSILSSSLGHTKVRQTVGEQKELVNAILFGADKYKSKSRKSSYQKDNSEMKFLKKDELQINCVGISVILNYIIEELFGIKGSGISIYKQSGEIVNHIANGIKIGDSLIWLDLTNNHYFIEDASKFNNDYYYEVNDFANSYFLGAIDNVSLTEWKKTFSKRFTKYMKSYLDFSGPKAKLSKANRDKIILWNNIKAQEF